MTDEFPGTTMPMERPRTRSRVPLRSLRVEVLTGPGAGRVVRFPLPLVRLGTAPDNDLVLEHPTVSRHHAEVRLADEGLVLEDLGSTNGSYLDGTQVLAAPVPDGSRIRLGELELLLGEEEETLVAETSQARSLGPMIGASPAMLEVYALLRAAAPTPVSVLLLGESGTGKELAARALHELSGRSGELVVFDAASTDPEQIRSELFGHQAGAFTGAAGARAGAFREADGGTLMIDEIGELPLELQPRLLRVLESRQVQPLGSDRRHRVDVRVVAATHRDLGAMVQEGSFRADLYHRLAVIPVTLPPLRERVGDVPLLARHLAQQLGLELRFSRAALRALGDHDWPGNVRELRNILERCAVLVQGREVEPRDLGLGSSPPGPSLSPTRESEDAAAVEDGATAEDAPTLEEVQRRTILEALEANGGNKAATARQLGIGLTTLKDRLKRYQSS